MHFTYSELKEIYEGLIRWFSKKDSDIDSLEGVPSASDTVVIMHNNINKKTTVEDLGSATQIQSDWNQVNISAKDYIKNKPTIPAAQVNSDWNAVSGKAQILNKPTIPDAQVNSDWNSNSGVSEILNKPEVCPSYIPYSSEADESYIKNYSRITDDSKFYSIVHTVIVDPPASFDSNYDLTKYLLYYINVLAEKDPSNIRIEFISYNDDDVKTLINLSSEKPIHLYGRFIDLGGGLGYKINTSKNTKTRCCFNITTMINSSNELEYHVTCELLGGYVDSIE